MTPNKEKEKACRNLIEMQRKRRHKRRFQRNFRVFLFVLICMAGLYYKRNPEHFIKKSDQTKKSLKDKDRDKKFSKPQEDSNSDPVPVPKPKTDPVEEVKKKAKADGTPDYIIELIDKNPETLEFVKDYAAKKDSPYFSDPIPLPEDGSFPHYLQFDERWGYMPYAGAVMANSGCGPTTCAMMASKILGDPSLTPSYMAKYARDNGFMSENDGTYGLFMSNGMQSLGINVTEGKMGKDLTIEALKEGHPIICLMKPGIFTSTGHYILLTSIKDEKIEIRDPFSTTRTNKLWSFEEIDPEISLMWCYSK